jgi:hypothetical protein
MSKQLRRAIALLFSIKTIDVRAEARWDASQILYLLSQCIDLTGVEPLYA